MLIFLAKKVLFSLKWHFLLNNRALNFLEQDLILLSILGNIDLSFCTLFLQYILNASQGGSPLEIMCTLFMCVQRFQILGA